MRASQAFGPRKVSRAGPAPLTLVSLSRRDQLPSAQLHYRGGIVLRAYLSPEPRVVRSPDTTMSREKLDPAKYLEFYRRGGRSFLPESLIEDFRTLVSTALNQRRQYWLKSFQQAEATWQESENPWEAFKDRCYDEARLQELAELEFLADELAILGLYRFVEIERNRVLLERFKFLDRSRMHSITYLNGAVPFLRTLFGSAAIDELRLLCNCIKHSGRVSRALAQCNPSWHEGERLGSLRDAYERLAPFVNAYWVDLNQTARDVAESTVTSNPPLQHPAE